MADGIESAAEKASDIVQDVGDTIQDSLILKNLTGSKNAADQKYTDSLTSISKEQEIQLEDQVSSPIRWDDICQLYNAHVESRQSV